jgi:hypothetical protein
MKTITIFKTDDWIRVYVDDEMIHDDHDYTLSPGTLRKLLNALGASAHIEGLYIDDLDEFYERAVV